MKARHKDIIRGAGFGTALGLVLLAILALLTRPYYQATVATIAPPSATPSVDSSPTVTSPPSHAPAISASPTHEALATATLASEKITHIVQEGDTLSSIAFKYGTTVQEIQAFNDLITTTIYADQVLSIPMNPVELPTPTAPVPGTSLIHTVSSDETLSHLAEKYGVSVDDIMDANSLTSEIIQIGWDLVIPVGEVPTERPTSVPGGENWQPSLLQGDLAAAYPLTMAADRFALHYQPDSLPAEEIDTILETVESSLEHIESTLQVNLQGHFDAYVAGSLFAAPNLALRGRSFSSQRRFFFLHDGTGTPADQRYILTHELTHLTTWNTMGPPISVMLHEGVAVYTGMELVRGGDHLPIQTFCAAYQEIDQLPPVSGSPSFQGHIRDLDTYYAAGCFVEYLIETYGPDKFADVYHTGDYYGNYGKSLVDLETDWLTDLESSDVALPFESAKLFSSVSEVAAGYDRLFARFTGTRPEMDAYRELDRARIAVLEGRLDKADEHLTRFDQLLTGAE